MANGTEVGTSDVAWITCAANHLDSSLYDFLGTYRRKNAGIYIASDMGTESWPS